MGGKVTDINAMPVHQLKAELLTARADKLRLEKQVEILRRNLSSVNARFQDLNLALESLAAVRSAVIGAIKENGPIIVTLQAIGAVTLKDHLTSERIRSAGADGHQQGLKLIVVEKPIPELKGG